MYSMNSSLLISSITIADTQWSKHTIISRPQEVVDGHLDDSIRVISPYDDTSTFLNSCSRGLPLPLSINRASTDFTHHVTSGNLVVWVRKLVQPLVLTAAKFPNSQIQMRPLVLNQFSTNRYGGKVIGESDAILQLPSWWFRVWPVYRIWIQ